MQYKYLDLLPIPIENSNEEIRVNKQLSLNILESLSFYRSLEDNRATKANTTNDLGTLNFLEVYLIQLINLSSIFSLNLEEESSHFSKFKSTGDFFKLPPTSYLEEILFANLSTFVSPYGSLGYELCLREIKEHYLHPSQIAAISIGSIFSRSLLSLEYSSELINNNNLLFIRGTNFILDDDINSDIETYSLPIKYLNIFPNVKNTLKAIEEFIPKLFNWYLGPFNNGATNIPSPSNLNTDNINAYNFLLEISRQALFYGIDTTTLSNLNYNFFHNNLSINTLNFIYFLISKRSLVPSTISITEETSLVNLFKETIDPLIRVENISGALTIITENLCPPGGYNLLLISTSLALINRAFILLTNDLNNNLVSRNRIYRLVYLAGYTLLKSSLKDVRDLGSRIIETSGLNIQTPNIITDLET